MDCGGSTRVARTGRLPGTGGWEACLPATLKVTLVPSLTLSFTEVITPRTGVVAVKLQPFGLAFQPVRSTSAPPGTETSR